MFERRVSWWLLGAPARLPRLRAGDADDTTSVQIGASLVAAAGGDAIEFETKEPEPGAATGGNFYVARRVEGGWLPEDIIPLESYTGCVPLEVNGAVGFSAELDRAVIFWGRNSRASEPGGSETEEQECNAEGLQVVPGEPIGYQNLLLRESATGAFGLVNTPQCGDARRDTRRRLLRGASSDLRHVVFVEPAALTADAPHGVEDLYEWEAGGGVRLVSVLPDNIATTGSLATTANGRPAISADGSDVLFTSGGSLYARITAGARFRSTGHGRAVRAAAAGSRT